MADRGSQWMRLRGFLRKEVLQIRRDPSSIVLAIVLPVVLLFIFGYGVSLDPEHVPIAIAVEDSSPAARDLAARFELSTYFDPIPVPTAAIATNLLTAGHVDAMLRIREDFTADLERDGVGAVQLVVNGVDANRARLIQGYAAGTVAKWNEVRAARGEQELPIAVVVRDRIWFNESAESTYFLVPGLLTLIMTLTGTLLTALVIAREWERGTMEAILATPLRPSEILLGKIIPYFVLGMCGMALSVLLGVTLFGVPLRGSLLLLVACSALFLLASLGLGLLISAVTRVQFVAAMASTVSGFLPAFFLSGLLFDLQSTPVVVQYMSVVIPAKYFVRISQTLFLAGNVWSVVLPAAAVLAVMAAVLLGLARANLTRRLPVS
jgi:ABC-2 type transport system permease protein